MRQHHRRARSSVSRLLTGLGVVLVMVLSTLTLQAVTSSASACDNPTAVTHPGGSVTYECSQGGSDGTGGSGGTDGTGTGGGGAPSCTLVLQATFCMGTRACWYEAWGPPWAIPQGKPPGKDAEKKVRTCLDPGGGGETMPVWVGGNQPQPPSLQEQAQTAFGQLNPALARSSPTRPR